MSMVSTRGTVKLILLCGCDILGHSKYGDRGGKAEFVDLHCVPVLSPFLNVSQKLNNGYQWV
jgi:hypothetical protein